MANYRKKRRYSGCWSCKPHKRFPGTKRLEGRRSALVQERRAKDEEKTINES